MTSVNGDGLLILLCHTMSIISTGITYFLLSVFFHVLHFRHAEIQLINKQANWYLSAEIFVRTLHYITLHHLRSLRHVMNYCNEQALCYR